MSSFVHTLSALGGSTPGAPASKRRIVGIDIARALAVFGMFGAHVLTNHKPLTWDPSTWSAIVNGRSSILFAVLAGVSLAIMTGRANVVTGEAMYQARVRIAVRALLIFLIGGIVTMFIHPIAVILEQYGIAFLMMLPFVGWASRRLLTWGISILVITPVAIVLFKHIHRVFSEFTPDTSMPWNLVFGGVYPALIWVGFMLIGMWIGRQDMASRKFATGLLVVGIAVAFASYGTAEYLEGKNGINDSEATAAKLTRTEDRKASKESASGHKAPAGATVPIGDYAKDGVVCQNAAPNLKFCGPAPIMQKLAGATMGGAGDTGALRGDLKGLGTWQPHSGSPFESIGSVGFACAVIGLCLLLPGIVTKLLWPITTVGSMSLSVYVGHVVAFIWYTVPRANETQDYIVFIVSAIGGACVWRIVFGQGPLERLLAFVSKRASRIPAEEPALAAPALADLAHDRTTISTRATEAVANPV